MTGLIEMSDIAGMNQVTVISYSSEMSEIDEVT